MLQSKVRADARSGAMFLAALITASSAAAFQVLPKVSDVDRKISIFDRNPVLNYHWDISQVLAQFDPDHALAGSEARFAVVVGGQQIHGFRCHPQAWRDLGTTASELPQTVKRGAASGRGAACQ